MLRTLMTASATAAGLKTSSHAGRKTSRIIITFQRKKKKKRRKKMVSRPIKSSPTFSAAGHSAFEGTRDGLPGFLLSRSLLQRHRTDQLTRGRGHLRRDTGHDQHTNSMQKKSPKQKTGKKKSDMPLNAPAKIK